MSAPPERSRRGRALGTASGALLAGAIIGLTAAALYLRTRNAGDQLQAEAPARAMALALARSGAQRSAHDTADPDLLQRRVLALAGRDTVTLATVVQEPRSTKYRFLRKRRYLAHSDVQRLRQSLDRRHPGDKQLYDLANRVRQHGPVVELRAPQDGPVTVVAAEPVRVDGKQVATAIVVTAPRPLHVPVNAWPIGAGVLALGLLGLMAGRLRQRYIVVMASLAGLTALCWYQLSTLAAFYHRVLPIPSYALRSALQGGSPAPLTIPAWPLVIALPLALGLATLGHVGLGQRMVQALRRHRAAYLYVLPAAVGMLLLVFLPFGYGLGLGFFNHAHGTYTFVGLSNFIEILSGGGRPLSHPLNFYFTLGVTVLWTGTNVLLHVAIGLALALVLKDPLLRFKGIYRVLLILPWAVPNYITALIWKGMFHHQYGAVNHVLELCGIENISWFSSFSTAFAANLVTNTWLGFPFMMVVCLGALQSIPRDVYEAADVDGASRWQSFLHITLPLLRPALFPAIILGTIWTFNMFNIIYLVSAGAPGGSTDILITEAYRWAFERADRYGLAAAYALIILVILLLYTLLTNRLTRATEDTYS